MGESSNNPSLKDKWLIDIGSELEKTSPMTSSWSICKVPVKLRSVNEDAYTPHIISIGPIHHEDKKLLRMEDHKRWYLIELFNRAENPYEILGVFYDIVIRNDEKVRACYAEPIVYDKQELAKILLHDAGFILELFFRYYEPVNSKIQDDPIFTTSWMLTALQRDLALLENQIPFSVLESLFKLIAAAGIPTLNQLALKFFKCMLTMSEEVLHKKGSQKSSHLLHLLYNCYLPIPKPGDSRSKGAYEGRDMGYAAPFPYERREVGYSAPLPFDGRMVAHTAPFPNEGREMGYTAPFPYEGRKVGYSAPVPYEVGYSAPVPQAGVVFEKNSTSHGAHEFEHSATSLRRAGVVFEKNSTEDLLDLQFDNGTFKIPPLHIYDFTDSHFRNLIAFEQCQRGSRHYIISYIIVLDKLIDTTSDVELLKRKGIIFNELGGEDDASNLFNSICKEVVYKDFYFKELCIKVNAYAESTWHRHKAILSSNYFNNPWSIISFVAAVALMILTFMQTLYSVLSYHKS